MTARPMALLRKLLLPAVLLVAALLIFELGDLVTLTSLKSGMDRFAAWRDGSPLLVGLGFFGLYVMAAAFSLPGAAVMTLAAGALFGLLWGTVIASFASSVGALLAFWVARHALRDRVQASFGPRLKLLNEGMARDGAGYLFTLRLVPVFPFFLVNLLMGLVPIRTATYYWVSQLGMLPATMVYVNAGTQLARIDSLSGILSPAVMGSLALLASFPFLAKGVQRWLARRRLYARWRRPRRFDRNLVVIGAGAAGLVTAYIGAAVKAKVSLVEAHKMGGDCLNYGCVPSKALIRSARLAHQIRHAQRYGLEPLAPAFKFRSVMARVREVVQAIAPHDSVERYTALGVEVLQGHARLVDPWTVEIQLNAGGVRRLTTRSVVIAAGASPVVPPLPGLDEVGYLTSDTLWDALAEFDDPPRRLVVLGGGPIGCELAQSLARLGSEVTQIEMAPRLMAREDEEVSELARASLQRDGVTVLTGHQALRCERERQGVVERKFIVVRHDGAERRIEFDALLCAVGRAARLQGYGLEELGVPVGRTVDTNEYLETLYPNIFAAGDVAGPYQFTHTAGHQAGYAAVNALFGRFKRFKIDHAAIPRATFIDPEVARVGLNEQEAHERGVAYELTRFDLSELDRAIADGAAQGFVKVLTVPGKDRILGVTIVGEHAGELLAEFVLAMRLGLGLNKILGTVHAYPTLAEANKFAAGEWRRAHTPRKVLQWLERYHAWQRG